MASLDETKHGNSRPALEPISFQQQDQGPTGCLKGPDSSRDALCKLRAQRLQQRQLQAQQSSGAPRPPPAANTRAPATDCRIQHDQQRAQQHTSAGPAARRLTTTAVRGMQTRPPSRTSSARGSPEPAAPAAAAVTATSRGRCSKAATTRQVAWASSHVLQPRAAQQQPKQQQQNTALRNQAAVCHTLSVQGVAVNLPQAAAAPARLRRSGVGQCAGGMLLGCGAAWEQLAAHAGAVARRSLLVGRQEQQQHRLLLARLVARQWRWFVEQRRRQHAAAAHRNRRLLLAGWSGLQQEAQAQRMLLGRAQQLATKHSFLLLSRCLAAWQQQLAQQQKQQALLAAFRGRQQRVAAQRVLRGWRLQVLAQRRHQQQLLHAEAHHTLGSMVKALQGWAAWHRDEQVMRLKASRAASHWQEVLQRRGLRAWRLAVTVAAEELYCLAWALSFHRQKQLTQALRGWAAASAAQRQARQRLVELLRQWWQRQQLHALRVAVRCWLALAQQRALLRQLQEQLVGQLQQRRRRKVLLYWLQLRKYRRQLAVAAAGIGDVGSWWWLLHCWQRWRCVVAAMQGRRCEELRQLVQMRASIGTWLKFTERQRRQHLQLAAAKARLRLLKLRQLLPAWHEAAQQLQHKRQQEALAQGHFVLWRRRQLLLLWQGNAADVAVERVQLAAAVEMHSRRLASRAFGGWISFCCYRDSKRCALPWHHHKLQLKAMQAWRQHVEGKRLRRQQAHQAEQHWRLAMLARAVAAWRAAVRLAARKQQLLLQADQHHEWQQLQRAMQAWRGPFLQLQRHKRGQRQQADATRQQTLLKQALTAWKASIVARRAQQQQLMMSALEAWQLALQQFKQERQELAAAAAPAERALAAGCARRVLRNWRQLAVQQQQERAAVADADRFRRRLQLQQGLRGWRLYQRQRHLRAVAADHAKLHRRSVLSSAVIHGLRAAVCAGRVKRLRLVSVALLRRQWLLSRACRAWRLASAMATMERAASCPSSTQQPAARPASGSTPLSHSQQQQQPGACLDAIAAAVVAASCASHAKWQQQWRRQWHETPDTSQPDQLQPVAAALANGSSSSSVQIQPGASQQQQQQLSDQLSHASAACIIQEPTAVLLSGDAAGQQQQQEQQQQPVACGSRTARRPPRLPAFMRTELQQQQQGQQQQGQQQQGQQQQACVAWQRDQPRLLPQQQQHQQQQPSACWPAAVAAAPAGQLSTGRKQRPQPRQLPAAFLAAGPWPGVPAQAARQQQLPHQPAAVWQPQAAVLHGARAGSTVQAAAHLALGITGLPACWPPLQEQQQPELTQPAEQVMLADELSAMESAVQACRQLEATVHLRQQQTAALQERLAAVLARDCPGGAEAGALGLQLSALRVELQDLLAEQSLQQPRLAGMMQRIKQFRAAAARQSVQGA